MTKIKYKRIIYQNEVNRFALGITLHRAKHTIRYNNYLSQDVNFSGFRGDQHVNSFGLLASNRFFLQTGKTSFFMDVELDFSYQHLSFQELRNWDGVVIPNNDVELNNFLWTFALQAGKEFHYIKEITPYLALGVTQNINSYYKETNFNSFITSSQPFHFASIVFTVGTRF